MKIGILETGAPPPALMSRFGGYPAMIGEMLGPGFETQSYDVTRGLPADPSDRDAYLITGSPAGVYEDHDWIPPLEDFLRAAKGKAKLVGLCFGHQIMAQAFGGRVEKSERGWGVGLQSYDVVERAPWMDGDSASFAIPVSHQDQVVEQPPASRVLARNAFSPFGLLAYDGQPAISFQGHPEWEPAFAKALIETRRARLPDPDAAIASLDRPNDRAMVSEWVRKFLKD